jgi:hypothetical protein
MIQREAFWERLEAAGPAVLAAAAPLFVLAEAGALPAAAAGAVAWAIAGLLGAGCLVLAARLLIALL